MRRLCFKFNRINRFLLFFLISTLLIFGLIGCGGGGGGGGGDDPPVNTGGDNKAPTSQDMSISVIPNGSLNGTLSGQDADGDSLTYQIVDPCSKGAVTLKDASTGAFTYTPNAGATGNDTFTFQCNDGTDNSNVATVTIDITEDAVPTANAGNDASAEEGSTVFLTGSATGSGNLTMAWSQVIVGAEPEVQVTDYADGTASFVAPDVTAEVALTFRMEVTDGQNLTDSDEVVITITEAASQTGLSGSLHSFPLGSTDVPTINLEAEGTLFWKHWGLGQGVDGGIVVANPVVTIKSSATDDSLISDYQAYPAGVTLEAQAYADSPFFFKWPAGMGTNDIPGDHTVNFISFHNYTYAQDQGFQIVVPADTTKRTLKLYLGTSSLNANVYAELSDGSSAPYSTAIENSINEPSANIVMLSYYAASAGQTLTVRYTYASDNDSTPGGTLNLYAATLQ